MPTSNKQKKRRLIVRLENIKGFIKKHLGQYYEYEEALDVFNALIKFEKDELRLMNRKK